MIARGSSDMIWVARRDVAQSGSALGWGPSGRRFESGRPDSLRDLDVTPWAAETRKATSFGDALPFAGNHRVHGPHRRVLLRRVRDPRLPLFPLRGRHLDVH